MENGKDVELRERTDWSYEFDKDKEHTTYRLHYKTKLKPRSHFYIRIYTVEPQVDDFYCHFFKDVADSTKIYFSFNIDLAKLDYEYWFPNEKKGAFEEIDKNNRNIIFSYSSWVFPGFGYMIAWERK